MEYNSNSDTAHSGVHFQPAAYIGIVDGASHNVEAFSAAVLQSTVTVEQVQTVTETHRVNNCETMQVRNVYPAL